MSTLKSMTAYARHAQEIGGDQYIWELRSVNHRYLDAHFRLPEAAQGLEQGIRQVLAKKVKRGRVDVNLSNRKRAAGGQPLALEREKLDQWAAWQDQVQAAVPGVRPLSVMDILGGMALLGDNREAESVDEKALLAGFTSALDLLLEQRVAEGQRLRVVLEEKLAAISAITQNLKNEMPGYEQAHLANWQARVEKLGASELDPLRLHQEMALLISKADVTEEFDRLASHIHEFSAALQSDKPVGRRLDFLLQEFNREANTLGSKSIHQQITNASVELKVLIDQLREQVQNIE